MPKVTKDKEAMQQRGEILFFLRRKRGLNQATVAENLGVSVQAYQKYEYGDADPTIDTLLKLADFYGVSVYYLLGREPKSPMLELPTKPISDDEFVKMYESLPPFAKEIFVEVMAKLSKAAQENLRQKKEEAPAPAPAPEPPKESPPIQVRQGQEQAIARTSDPTKQYRPAPTAEQLKSFTVLTPEDFGEK